MLPQIYIVITTLTNLAILFFLGIYFSKSHKHEQELENKEKKIDTQYHQVVDNALTRERKIIEDATTEADKIIVNAKYTTEESQKMVEAALQKMISDIHIEAQNSAKNVGVTYQESLKQLSEASQLDFQTVTNKLKSDLELQLNQYQSTLLPALQKELDEYKLARMSHIERTVNLIIQKVAQEVFNKSIPLADHEQLIIGAMEKAKKEGMFG